MGNYRMRTGRPNEVCACARISNIFIRFRFFFSFHSILFMSSTRNMLCRFTALSSAVATVLRRPFAQVRWNKMRRRSPILPETIFSYKIVVGMSAFETRENSEIVAVYCILSHFSRSIEWNVHSAYTQNALVCSKRQKWYDLF